MTNASATRTTAARTDLDDLMSGFNRTALVALAVMTAWALLMPLDSAVIAPGTVVSGGQNKVLQSRSGGTVIAIHVRDGQKLDASQPIVDLDASAETGELTRLSARRATLVAMQRRLEAEKVLAERTGTTLASGTTPLLRRGLDIEAARATIALRGEPEPDASPRLEAEQQREFEKGRQALAAEIAMNERRREALVRKRDGLIARVPLIERQLQLVQDQLTAATRLLAGGYVAKKQVWDIEARAISHRAELVSARADLDAAIAGVAELDEQIIQIRSQDARITSQRLTEVLGELNQIGDQIFAARRAISEKAIRAPRDGTLVRWTVTTIGAVVKPGEVIGEIVPNGAGLEVDARVAPRDIASIHVGQRARVKVSSFDTAVAEPIDGEVTVVAADSSVDQRTNERHFQVRVRLTGTPVPAGIGVGMTGEVHLEGPRRTFAMYLLQPLTDSYARAFREH